MSACRQPKDWESVLSQIGKMEAVGGVLIVKEGGSCGRGILLTIEEPFGSI